MSSNNSFISGNDDEIQGILDGAIDTHIHAGPDPYIGRKLDARQLAEDSIAAGMAGIVLKSHDYPTQPLAWALNRFLDNQRFQVYGALALNFSVGGLNPRAVDVALRLGTSVIWMPTYDSRQWDIAEDATTSTTVAPIGVSDDGVLLPVCHEILDLISQHNATLASGHLNVEETHLLLAEARQRDIRCVVTHASFWMPLSSQKDLAKLGCFIEHSAIATTGKNPTTEFKKIILQIQEIGSQHVILSSDLGQSSNPRPTVGLAHWVRNFLSSGFSEKQITQMIRENPRSLLGK